MSRRDKISASPVSLFSFQDIITSLSGILILLVLIMAVQVAVEKSDADVHGQREPLDNGSIPELKTKLATLKEQLAILDDQRMSQTPYDAVSLTRQTIRTEQETATRLEQLAIWSNQYLRLNQLLQERATELEKLTDIKDKLEAEREAVDADYKNSAAGNRLFLIPDSKTSTKIPIVVECRADHIRMGYLDRNDPPLVFTSDAQGAKAFKRELARIPAATHYFVFFIKPSGIGAWERFCDIVIKDYDVGYDALEEESSLAIGSENI